MEDFFSSCESALAEDGLLVLQSTSIADERYDEYWRSSDFIKEYIFPGGCLPSLSRITSAMGVASRFSVEHVENIGSHYYLTLRSSSSSSSSITPQRKAFLTFLIIFLSKILAMGFDEKFIRTWEYYFDYGASGFKSCTLLNYQMLYFHVNIRAYMIRQIVFSRPGNVGVLGDPYKATMYWQEEHRIAGKSLQNTRPPKTMIWKKTMNKYLYDALPICIVKSDDLLRGVKGGEASEHVTANILTSNKRLCLTPCSKHILF
ncbi:hypothetical protein NC652_025146 [Populus alba x Populus x berolinensis]|nr:hypothetical protein NC652_025146 [Populus alba x Populus x berolinensis]